MTRVGTYRQRDVVYFKPAMLKYYYIVFEWPFRIDPGEMHARIIIRGLRDRVRRRSGT